VQSTNVETVHRGFQAWADDDLEQFLATLDPEVEFQPSGVFPDFDSTYRGHDAVSQFWSRLQEPWKQLRLIPTRTEEHGDCVAVELEFLAVGAVSDAEVNLELATAYRFKNDLVTAIVVRRTFAEALHAIAAWQREPVEQS
jgi:ketosteroid isomerase-like protein